MVSQNTKEVAREAKRIYEEQLRASLGAMVSRR